MPSHLTYVAQLVCLRAHHREMREHYLAQRRPATAETHRLVVFSLEQQIRARVTP